MRSPAKSFAPRQRGKSRPLKCTPAHRSLAASRSIHDLLLCGIGAIVKQLVRETIRTVRRAWQVPRAPLEAIDDPHEAITRLRQGQPVGLSCPRDACVIFNGLSFSQYGYHPFAAAAAERLACPEQQFSGSSLERYYASWQPRDALEALIGAADGPGTLKDYAPYLMLAPWLDTTLADRQAWIEKTLRWESQASAAGPLGPADGHGLQGPVSPAKGQAEYARLAEVLESITRHGFDRTRGEIAAQLLKRDGEVRYRIVHGHHRAAALAASGYDKIPVEPSQIIDVDEVASWPHVRSGFWAASAAAAYFHHHFDFDSAAWARARGLLR